MLHIVDKNKCCGCYACYNACAQGALSCEHDKEGFFYPIIDTQRCVGCKACVFACPVAHTSPEVVNKSQRGYLIQIRDNAVRRESTSGGAFTAIASWVIDHGGVVFGASLDLEKREVRHRWSDSKEQLAHFRNSKYVQSNIGDSFNHARRFLREGRYVCFSGTPCQIEGLKRFLRKKYERLLTIDVVCYGIPSPGVFRDYVNWQQEQIGGKFIRMLFREKRYSYNYTSVSIFNEQSELDYHKGVEWDQFMRSFFTGINVRPSCYACCFKKRYRTSDFTLWDCYDVKKFSQHFDEEGTNRVLVHSTLGQKVMEEIKSSIRWEEYTDLDYFVADEDAMVQSVKCPKEREAFFADYARMDFNTLMAKWYPHTWRVWVNFVLRRAAYKLGVYNSAKRIVKRFLKKK